MGKRSIHEFTRNRNEKLHEKWTISFLTSEFQVREGTHVRLLGGGTQTDSLRYKLDSRPAFSQPSGSSLRPKLC
jgi:hypothetical protein